MFKFEKPEYKVTDYSENDYSGKFILEPLERGFGTTIGNALRRVMLSSLPGCAVSSIKIEGVLHEFQKIDGIVEDVTGIVLNIKKLVLKSNTNENAVLYLKSDKEGEVRASDIEKNSDVEVINPDLVICTLAKGGSIDMTLNVSNGKGYVDARDNRKMLEEKANGLIAVDSLYSPVKLVNYEVEEARVGQSSDYDKLTINIHTNGAIKPEEAISMASEIIISHFELIAATSPTPVAGSIFRSKEVKEEVKTLETSIEELDLSVRAYNCLKRAGKHTLQDLTCMTVAEIMKIRNLGKKSLKEVIDKVKNMNLKFKDGK